MFSRTLTALCVVIGTVMGLLTASAVSAQAPSRESPAPETTNVPSFKGESAPTSYRSSFEGYRAFKEDKVPWLEANEEVDRIGGWKAYAKEAHQTGDAPAAGGEKTAPADPHAGHH